MLIYAVFNVFIFFIFPCCFVFSYCTMKFHAVILCTVVNMYLVFGPNCCTLPDGLLNLLLFLSDLPGSTDEK